MERKFKIGQNVIIIETNTLGVIESYYLDERWYWVDYLTGDPTDIYGCEHDELDFTPEDKIIINREMILKDLLNDEKDEKI